MILWTSVWATKDLEESESDIESFKFNLKKSKIERNCVVVNMPFMANLSGPDGV